MQKKAPETSKPVPVEIDFAAYRVADPEEFSRNMLRLMEEGGKVMTGFLERANGKSGPVQHGQRADRGGQAVQRDRPALGDGPGKLAETHGALAARLHAAGRRHRAAHDGRRGAAGRRARARRQPLQGPGVEPQPLLRFLEAGLSHHHALARGGAGRDRGPRRAHAPARRVLPQAAGERALALELSRHQSRGAARDACLERQQPRAGHGQPRARHGEVGRHPQHQPDRRGGLRGRPQRRHRARQGRLPERPHPADPVRALAPTPCTRRRC